MRGTLLQIGEPAPWFACATAGSPRFSFDTVAGRHVVLCFFGSAASPAAAKVLGGIGAHRGRFDDVSACFFGVSNDPDDRTQRRVADAVPGLRYFWDFDGRIRDLYGAREAVTYLLDPGLRVLAVLPWKAQPEKHVAFLVGLLERLPLSPPAYRAPPQAPVLVLPRIFEPKLCQALIEYYQAQGGRESGFMRDVDGRTVGIVDYRHKRRSDCMVEDEALRRACMHRIHDRLAPEVHKAFQFRATRMERSVVACYEAELGGHFRAHRDNTTKGTAHRRFAVSLFLNSGEYEGGFLRFPEFGPALFNAPTGGAVVFSCSLLHEATVVTRGRRYMFLPFLYDDDARRVRDDNLQFLEGETTSAA